MVAVLICDLVENAPLVCVERPSAGAGDPNHIEPVFFSTGLGAVVLEVDAVTFGELLGFLVDIAFGLVADMLRQGADNAFGVELVLLDRVELVVWGLKNGFWDLLAGHQGLLAWVGGSRAKQRILGQYGRPTSQPGL